MLGQVIYSLIRYPDFGNFNVCIKTPLHTHVFEKFGLFFLNNKKTIKLFFMVKIHT